MSGEASSVAEFLRSATPAWIVAFAEVGLLYFTHRNRKKPSRIVVREVERSSLVRVRPQIRHSIKAEFNGKPALDLGQITLDFKNWGSEVIRDAKIGIDCPEGTTILRVLATNPDIVDPALVIDVRQSANLVNVHIPFLNPAELDPPPFRLTIIMDGENQQVTVVGQGPGWTVKQVRSLDLQDEFSRFNRVAAITLSLMILALIYVAILATRGVVLGPFSLRSPPLTVPALLVVLVSGFIMWRGAHRILKAVNARII
jgi:hypothetical protein